MHIEFVPRRDEYEKKFKWNNLLRSRRLLAAAESSSSAAGYVPRTERHDNGLDDPTRTLVEGGSNGGSYRWGSRGRY